MDFGDYSIFTMENQKASILLTANFIAWNERGFSDQID